MWACGYTSVYFLKNFLLQVVILLDPSTRMTHWSNWRTSITVTVLSYFFGCGPVWFWMRTWSIVTRGGSHFVCSDQYSSDFMCRFLSAASLASRVSFQVGWGWYLPCGIGVKSFMGRPKMHIARDTFVIGSGVFGYWSMAVTYLYPAVHLVCYYLSSGASQSSHRFLLYSCYEGRHLMIVYGAHPMFWEMHLWLWLYIQGHHLRLIHEECHMLQRCDEGFRSGLGQCLPLFQWLTSLSINKL